VCSSDLARPVAVDTDRKAIALLMQEHFENGIRSVFQERNVFLVQVELDRGGGWYGFLSHDNLLFFILRFD
jgi:hypothetical protein